MGSKETIVFTVGDTAGFYAKPSAFYEEKQRSSDNIKEAFRPRLPTAIDHKEVRRVLIEKLSRPLADGCLAAAHRAVDDYFEEIHGNRDPWEDSIEDWVKNKDGRSMINKTTLGWLFNNDLGTMRNFMKHPPHAIRADCESCGAYDETGLKMARENFLDYMERREFLADRSLHE